MSLVGLGNYYNTPQKFIILVGFISGGYYNL